MGTTNHWGRPELNNEVANTRLSVSNVTDTFTAAVAWFSECCLLIGLMTGDTETSALGKIDNS